MIFTGKGHYSQGEWQEEAGPQSVPWSWDQCLDLRVPGATP